MDAFRTYELNKRSMVFLGTNYYQVTLLLRTNTYPNSVHYIMTKNWYLTFLKSYNFMEIYHQKLISRLTIFRSNSIKEAVKVIDPILVKEKLFICIKSASNLNGNKSDSKLDLQPLQLIKCLIFSGNKPEHFNLTLPNFKKFKILICCLW